MRSKLATSALVIFLGALLVTGSAEAFWNKDDDAVEGSGKAETRTLELGDFDRMDIGGVFEIYVTRGDEHRVTVTIDDNLWDLLEAEVHRGELTFGWDEKVEPDVDPRIEITAPTLKSIDIHGAAEIEIEDFKGDRFEFSVSGAAELEMDGRVDELQIHVSGAGEIDTRKLEARSVEISVSGAGEARVFASESFEGKVSGAGNISCSGNPKHKKTRVSGVGNIDVD